MGRAMRDTVSLSQEVASRIRPLRLFPFDPGVTGLTSHRRLGFGDASSNPLTNLYYFKSAVFEAATVALVERWFLCVVFRDVRVHLMTTPFSRPPTRAKDNPSKVFADLAGCADAPGSVAGR